MNRFKATFLKLIKKEIVFADSRLIFARKYLVPGIAIILFLMSFGQFYSAKISENELIEVSGKINSIKFEVFKHYNDTTDERITIYLDGYSKPFYFIENNSSYFNTIMKNVKRNDVITIKHRTKFQSLIGTGKQFQILYLSKNSEVIYNLENPRKNYWEVGKFSLLGSIIMWILYLWMKLKYKIK